MEPGKEVKVKAKRGRKPKYPPSVFIFRIIRGPVEVRFD